MKNFLRCGIVGWCLEILWTSFGAFRRREMQLIGNTSLIMFPIYGMAAIIKPAYSFLKKRNFLFRGTIYTIGIFTAEYITGVLLKKKKMCPWDYSKSKFNLEGVIRLDFAPLWFLSGLIFEKLVVKTD